MCMYNGWGGWRNVEHLKIMRKYVLFNILVH